eukprot:1149551-Pelagomonas_calceolata.AAC.2
MGYPDQQVQKKESKWMASGIWLQVLATDGKKVNSLRWATASVHSGKNQQSVLALTVSPTNQSTARSNQTYVDLVAIFPGLRLALL